MWLQAPRLLAGTKRPCSLLVAIWRKTTASWGATELRITIYANRIEYPTLLQSSGVLQSLEHRLREAADSCLSSEGIPHVPSAGLMELLQLRALRCDALEELWKKRSRSAAAAPYERGVRNCAGRGRTRGKLAGPSQVRTGSGRNS
jgi:hypothetical protein